MPCYNSAAYVKNALESIKNQTYNNWELIAVNDGSKDETPEILRAYAKEDSRIKVLDKENGGYGTTVNWSAEHASGKYFKLLDGDDWFDTKGLDSLLKQADAAEADLYLSEVQRVVDGVPQNSRKKFTAYAGKVLAPEEIPERIDFGMWAVMFRTEVLKKTLRKLPEHSLYTDVLYSTYPLPEVKKIGFCPDYVYCYRLGRDEQSVSRVSRNKHYMEYQNIVETVKRYYYECDGTKLCDFLQYRFLAKYKNEIFNLLLLPPSPQVKKEIIRIEKETKKNMPEFYVCAGRESKKIRLLRMTGYLTYRLLAKYADNSW
jgi:glycosyltransferase involved in cell wall biosynthesis